MLSRNMQGHAKEPGDSGDLPEQERGWEGGGLAVPK